MRRKPWIAAVGFALLVGVALVLVTPGALTGEAAAGCAPGDDLAAAELAKSEGRYLVMEMMVVLGLTLEQADKYIEIAAPLATPGATTGEACYSAEQLPGATQTSAAVRVDFTSCPGESGSIELGVEVPVPPAGSTSPPDPNAVHYDLAMYDTKPYGVLLEGNLGIDNTSSSETMTTDLSFDFLDYAGALAVDGTVERDDAAQTQTVTLAGTLSSVGGLDWDVQGSNLAVAEDCRGLAGGQMTARYGNELVDEVLVVATFDGTCDGCADVTIDGVPKPEICIPDILQL